MYGGVVPARHAWRRDWAARQKFAKDGLPLTHALACGELIAMRVCVNRVILIMTHIRVYVAFGS